MDDVQVSQGQAGGQRLAANAQAPHIVPNGAVASSVAAAPGTIRLASANKSCLREQRMKEQERAMVLLQQQIASSPSPRSQRDKL